MIYEHSGSVPRSSNKCRSQWRDRCRQELANHIAGHLGYIVDPREVRLLPRTTDPYIWHHGPGQRHLFGKQLSKHNIGAYRELCREVGRSILAVARDSGREDSGRAAGHGTLPGSGSPTMADDYRHKMERSTLAETIKRLETENDVVGHRLNEALSLSDEQTRMLAEFRAESERLTKQVSHLQATLHLRNAEAIRQRRSLETNSHRLQQLGILVRNWEQEAT